jgi:5,10-methylene-tetrahydrofolate dehydrogenase/methenyl tetrahydrofolate cyclohydrolase
MATIIDGKAVAQTIRSEIAEEVRLLSQKYGKVCYVTPIFIFSLDIFSQFSSSSS